MRVPRYVQKQKNDHEVNADGLDLIESHILLGQPQSDSNLNFKTQLARLFIGSRESDRFLAR